LGYYQFSGGHQKVQIYESIIFWRDGIQLAGGSSLLEDITASLQETISRASSKEKDPSQYAEIQIPRGDYYVQLLTIPKNHRVLIYSKDRVRLLYAGKRNRPMFVLEDNSVLVLREKLELYYNTNNMQEVTKLMIRCPKSSSAEISKQIKVSFFSMKQQD